MDEVKEKVFELKNDFTKFYDSLEQEKQKRLNGLKNYCKFGIKFFDDAIGGIGEDDLVLLSARMGAGKTQMATNIAMTNAIEGKKVCYFALEAHNHEIARRIKYNFVAKYFYEDKQAHHYDRKLSYRKWYKGLYNNELNKYEELADLELKQMNLQIQTFYKTTNEYKIEDFEKHVLEIKNGTDLIILDHLHYFDSDETNENAALKTITKRLRSINGNYNVPIVAVAHFRKRDRMTQMITPNIEDIHGSSDIGKIATLAIALAPAMDQPNSNTSFPTYFKVMKSRIGSEIERYLALCDFDITTNTYSQDYFLGKGSDYTTKFEQIEKNQYPDWATRSIKNERD